MALITKDDFLEIAKEHLCTQRVQIALKTYRVSKNGDPDDDMNDFKCFNEANKLHLVLSGNVHLMDDSSAYFMLYNKGETSFRIQNYDNLTPEVAQNNSSIVSNVIATKMNFNVNTYGSFIFHCYTASIY